MLNDINKKHRVIGIRHTLKKLKDSGLIDDEIFYPEEAVEEIQDEIILKAIKWYKIGAKRGILEFIKAILNKDIEIKMDENGNIEISTNLDKIVWTRQLKINIGNKKIKTKTKVYIDFIKDLEFNS